MNEKEIEKDVRKWLDYVVNKGSYNMGVVIALTNLYYEGANDVHKKIKDALFITDCDSQ